MLERRDCPVRDLAWKEYEKCDASVSGLHVAHGSLAGGVRGGGSMAVSVFLKLKSMGKAGKVGRLSASMTVEASYIMAMVILSLAVFIRTAYGRCKMTAEVMELHRAVEQLRFTEENWPEKILPHGQAKRNQAQVEGYLDTDSWKKEIISGLYEPEEVLRKLTVFEKRGVSQEGKGE